MNRRLSDLAAMLGVGLWLLTQPGCQLGGKPAPPAQFAAPSARTSVTHYVGSPLSGPTTRPAAKFSPSDALKVRVSLIATEKLPAGGEPLAGHTRLISTARGNDALLSSARLTRQARFAVGQTEGSAASAFGDVGQTAEMLAGTGAVPRGATASFEVMDSQLQGDSIAGEGWYRRVQVLVHWRPNAAPSATQPATSPATASAPDPELIEIALVLEDLTTPRALRADEDTRPDVPTLLETDAFRQRETAIVERLTPTPGGPITLAFALPFQFGGSPAAGIVAFVEVAAPSADPLHEEAANRAMADMEVSAKFADERANRNRLFSGDSGGLLLAAQMLGQSEKRRSAMIYLAGQTGANLCGDAALTADDGVLATLADDVQKQLFTGKASAPMPPPAIGWLLDRTTFQTLGSQLNAGKLPPELSAVLSTHAGEAGRNSSSVEQVLRGLTTRADFDARLLGENLIFLEDSSPAARVRAFDWLHTRGLAPTGYDPLDSPKARRDALERARSAPPAAPAPSGNSR